MEGLTGDRELVENGLERKVGEVRLWRNYQTAVEGADYWGFEKEVQYLSWIEVHEGVVHEDDGSVWKIDGGGGIAGGVGWSEPIIAEMGEIAVQISKFLKLLGFHEHHGGWLVGKAGPVVVKEKSLDYFVSWVGMRSGSQTRVGNA